MLDCSEGKESLKQNENWTKHTSTKTSEVLDEENDCQKKVDESEQLESQTLESSGSLDHSLSQETVELLELKVETPKEHGLVAGLKLMFKDALMRKLILMACIQSFCNGSFMLSVAVYPASP